MPEVDLGLHIINNAHRTVELDRRVRLRRMQERQAAARDYRLMYEPKTPLTRQWAIYDLSREWLNG